MKLSEDFGGKIIDFLGLYFMTLTADWLVFSTGHKLRLWAGELTSHCEDPLQSSANFLPGHQMQRQVTVLKLAGQREGLAFPRQKKGALVTMGNI